MLILLNSIAGLVVLTWFSLNTAWWMFFFQVMDGEIILTRSLAHPAAMIPLKRDATPIGSWALLADSCPAGTAECSDVREYTVGKPCCPTGTKCYAHGFGDQSNCCPGGKPFTGLSSLETPSHCGGGFPMLSYCLLN